MTCHENRFLSYFSMEIGLRPDIPSYSGGLGVLAGDTIRSAADLHIPMVAVTLLHRKGYFRQGIDSSGWQVEKDEEWPLEKILEPTNCKAQVTIEGRAVHVTAWKFEVEGHSQHMVPVYLLDTDLPENADQDRAITHHLYGGGKDYRIKQEIVLGIGGVRILRALGYDQLKRFHANEGHAALLCLELMEEELNNPENKGSVDQAFESVKRRCVFTTHTPVPAGHDIFPQDLVRQVLGDHRAFALSDKVFLDGTLNMTHLALNFSFFANSVAKKHRQVSQSMFPNYEIDSITNGVHAATWISPAFERLFDEHISGWKEQNHNLRYALSIPRTKIWEAHMENKKALIDLVKQLTGAEWDPNVFTIGYARRMTAYKRPDLIFMDLERLHKIAENAGPMQIVFGGKAHPQDQNGKDSIKKIFQITQQLKNQIKVVYLPNYEMGMAKPLIAGVDLWLNNPEPPLEASGTSGMKAALNGVPCLSVLDGWWIEGWIEGVTGWSIGSEGRVSGETQVNEKDGDSLYGKLEHNIIPAYYQNIDQYIGVMANSIALNGSFFNTQRMMLEYLRKAYFDLQ